MYERVLFADIVNRICNYAEIDEVCISKEIIDIDIYPSIKKITTESFGHFGKKGLYVLFVDKQNARTEDIIIKMVELNANAIIYSREQLTGCSFYDSVSFPIFPQKADSGWVSFIGPLLAPQKKQVPKEFKVLAVMHCYNEEDIIERTIDYLLDQGLYVLVLDNWSDDMTYEIVNKLRYKNPERVMLERFPKSGKTDAFNLYDQLQYTEYINDVYEYNWFIHYDADEMRLSPWRGFSLLEAIFIIDQMGFNLIENTVIDFRITNSECKDIFFEDGWFEFGKREAHFRQRKTWKRAARVELKESGGHMAVVDSPKVFPIKFLTRHYPLRSIAHAQKKIFRERLPRFSYEKEKRGWHKQYDVYTQADSFVCNTDNLIKWENNTFRQYYASLFFGVGILDNNEHDNYSINSESVQNNERIVIYGAGECGKKTYRKLCNEVNVVGWIDRNSKYMTRIYGVEISDEKALVKLDYDKIVVAVCDEIIAKEIVFKLKETVKGKKIVWMPDLHYRELD